MDHQHQLFLYATPVNLVLNNHKIKHFQKPVNICWYPVDPGIFTLAAENDVILYDTASMQQAYKFKLYNVKHHTWNDRLIACANSNQVSLLDPNIGSSCHTLRQGVESCSLAWSPSREHLLASGGGDGVIRLWDIRRSYTPIDEIQDSPTTNGLLFSEDGISLFATNTSNKLECYNVFSKEPRCTFGPHFQNNSKHKTMKSKRFNLFYPSRNQVLQYCYKTGKLKNRLKGHLYSILDLALGTDCLYSCAKDGILIWTRSKRQVPQHDDWSD